MNDERDCAKYKEEFRRKIASHCPRLQYKDVGVEIYGYRYGEDGKADKDTKKDNKDGNKLYNPENLLAPPIYSTFTVNILTSTPDQSQSNGSDSSRTSNLSCSTSISLRETLPSKSQSWMMGQS